MLYLHSFIHCNFGYVRVNQVLRDTSTVISVTSHNVNFWNIKIRRIRRNLTHIEGIQNQNMQDIQRVNMYNNYNPLSLHLAYFNLYYSVDASLLQYDLWQFLNEIGIWQFWQYIHRIWLRQVTSSFNYFSIHHSRKLKGNLLNQSIISVLLTF